MRLSYHEKWKHCHWPLLTALFRCTIHKHNYIYFNLNIIFYIINCFVYFVLNSILWFWYENSVKYFNFKQRNLLFLISFIELIWSWNIFFLFSWAHKKIAMDCFLIEIAVAVFRLLQFFSYNCIKQNWMDQWIFVVSSTQSSVKNLWDDSRDNRHIFTI